MIANVFDDNERYPMVHVLASVLAWASAVVNPVVYGFMSRRYREAYANLFAFRCVKGHWAPATSSSNSHENHSSTRQTESMDASMAYLVNGNVLYPVNSASLKNNEG